MNEASNLTIVIPTRNRPRILERTLQELLDSGFGECPLIVYDDASDDAGAVAAVVTTFRGAHLLRSDKKKGQAEGRNHLLEAAETPYALLLDDDSWPEDREVVFRALREMQSRSLAVATFQYRALSDGALSHGGATAREEVVSFLGGAAILDIAKVVSVGGFRAFFRFGFEEPELGMRLWMAGKRIEFFPEGIFAHNQHYTPDENRDYREYDYLYSKNAVLFSSMNFPLSFGLPHGLLRSLRRLPTKGWRHVGSKVLGTFRGVIETFRYWSCRTPCDWSQIWPWLRYRGRGRS